MLSPSFSFRVYPRLHQALAIGMGIAWLGLHRDSLGWFAGLLFQEEIRLNLLLFLLLGGLLLRRIHRAWKAAPGLSSEGAPLREEPSPVPLLPAFLFALGMGLWLLSVFVLRSNFLSAFAFGLGSYGLLGFFLGSRLWQRGLPAALMLLAILPFGSYLDTYVGFPIRVWTAQKVGVLLQSVGLISVTAQDVILLENGIAHVDLPCSGVKSLWSGAIFFFAATWIEDRKLSIPWFFVGLFFVGCLVFANLMRVFLLVLVGFLLKKPELAQAIHLPLGLLGFFFACSLAYLFLRFLPSWPSVQGRPDGIFDVGSPLSSGVAAVGIVVFGLGAVFQPWKTTFAQRPRFSLAALSLPEAWDGQALPLTSTEESFFAQRGASVAKKWRFSAQTGSGLRGSLLVVSSSSWQAHHPPELCYAGNGLRVGGIESFAFLSGQAKARKVRLEDGRLTGIYWYQAPRQTTDELLTRIWQGLTARHEGWILVSLLFETSITPEAPEAQVFFSELHRWVHQTLHLSSHRPRRDRS